MYRQNVWLTVHVDLLAQLDQLHLCWHVAHCPHAVPQVFTADEAVFVLVKLLECLPQLWEQHRGREEGMNLLPENTESIFFFYSLRMCNIPSISSGLSSRSCEGSQRTVRIWTWRKFFKSCWYVQYSSHSLKKKRATVGIRGPRAAGFFPPREEELISDITGWRKHADSWHSEGK